MAGNKQLTVRISLELYERLQQRLNDIQPKTSFNQYILWLITTELEAFEEQTGIDQKVIELKEDAKIRVKETLDDSASDFDLKAEIERQLKK